MDKTDNFYEEAFARNKGLISDSDQAKLRNARVAIAGLGGVGGVYLTGLARLGIGKFNIADNDTFELVNLNRQAGAFVSTVGQSKVEVMQRVAEDINPYLDVRTFNKGIDSKNIDEFLTNVDVVMDGIDFFNMKDRLLLFQKSREHKIPVVSSAPIGFGATLLTFDPDKMTFEEYFDIREDQSEEEQLLQFGLGLSPSLIHRKYYPPNLLNFKEKKAPSASLSVLLCANMASTQVFKIITGRKYFTAPTSIQFDPFVEKLRRFYLWRGNKNPIQKIKKWFVKRKLSSYG
ncbi:MAG: hypothetical protein A2816_00090 [Candidatus Yanofskybacteria bacterium RIFCSPHIGHO2_01_FULL_39_44]|nr:MAG: hypothetical protein A2816_00090 [Candidatus Yanofskybacteria bacterium RIFCSPHIGHO2_01_FULL_39_44]